MKLDPSWCQAALGLLGVLLVAGPNRALTAPPAPPVPALAQDPGVVPPEEDERTRKKRLRRDSDVDRLYARVDEMKDVWSDEASVERGRAALDELLAAAGGLEAWEALGGLRVQVLEARLALARRDPERWSLHHYVPRLCAFTLEGDGYLYSEFAEIREEEARASYLRQVAAGGLGWSEKQGHYYRGTRVGEMAVARVRRQFLMNAMPFSLHALGARLAYARTEQVPDPETGADRELDMYLMRVSRDVGLIMEDKELITDFVVHVDPEAKRVVQLQYILTGDDRDSLDIAYTRSYVEFEGELTVGGVRLPAETALWHEDPVFTLRWTAAEPVAEELAPEALRKPWLGSLVYEPPFRADHWDPPPPETDAESPAGADEAPGSEGTGAGGSGL